MKDVKVNGLKVTEFFKISFVILRSKIFVKCFIIFLIKKITHT